MQSYLLKLKLMGNSADEKKEKAVEFVFSAKTVKAARGIAVNLREEETKRFSEKEPRTATGIASTLYKQIACP